MAASKLKNNKIKKGEIGSEGGKIKKKLNLELIKDLTPLPKGIAPPGFYSPDQFVYSIFCQNGLTRLGRPRFSPFYSPARIRTWVTRSRVSYP